MQDIFRDMVDATLEEISDMDIKEAEEQSYEELKPRHISNVIDKNKRLKILMKTNL